MAVKKKSTTQVVRKPQEETRSSAQKTVKTELSARKSKVIRALRKLHPMD